MAICFGLVLLGLPALAAADARVQVVLRDSAGRPIDGTVTMVAGARRLTCRTTAGRCTITAPAGSYSATVAARSGGTPPARTVAVPGAGTVSLAITTPGSATSGGTASDAGTRSRPPTTGMSVVGAVVGSRGTGTSSDAGTRTTTRTADAGTRSTTSGTGSTSGTATSTRPASLSTGARVVCQGTVRDAAGRAVDATITVRRGSTTLGTVRTTAGRFSIYDLAAGSYSLSASGAGGAGSTTVNLTSSMARPTITLR